MDDSLLVIHGAGWQGQGALAQLTCGGELTGTFLDLQILGTDLTVSSTTQPTASALR